MRINQIVDQEHHSILEDKAFIRQFSLLLSLIIAISLFLIYYSVHRIDHLSVPALFQEETKPLSLGEVEREVNGNVITLEVLEDTFSDLAQMDLQELQMQREATAPGAVQKPSAPSSGVRAVAKKAPSGSHIRKSAIQITSTPISGKRAHPAKSIGALRKKFYASNDIRYALQIAGKLMDAQKYKEALKWSLIANEIAPQSAASWMLFAKIKLKMGKKQDAVNVLSAYLQSYDSAKVARMLKKIKS